MRRLSVFFACFVAAFIIGLGSVLVFTEPAVAMYCDVYSTHLYHSQDGCTDKMGNHGTMVYQCEGYLFFNGQTYHCGCSRHHCEVPPDDIPYQEP